jgi:colanic acid/amylovoran biosynthesis protein
MTEILITNAYSWFNKGDAGIIQGMTEAFDRIFDDPNYTILSFTPEVDDREYPMDAKFLSDPLNVSFGKGRTSKLRIPLRALLHTACGITKSGLDNDIAKAYRDADFVLSCGGGFLGGDSFVSLVHVFSIWLANLHDKDYYIFAQSINPMNRSLIEAPTKHVLNRADEVLPREQITERYVQDLGIQSEIRLIPDAAFMLTPDREASLDDEVSSNIDDEMIIGVTTRDWSFPRYEDVDRRLANYRNAISETINKLVETYDAKIVFLPQVVFEPHDDDRRISERIANQTDSRSNVELLTADYTPRELISFAESCDIFLGTRMHSNIFSLVAGTPTGAISYQPKTDGIMEMVGLEDNVVDIGTVSADELYALAERLVSESEVISAHLDRRIPELREEILREVELIADAHAESSETRSQN